MSTQSISACSSFVWTTSTHLLLLCISDSRNTPLPPPQHMALLTWPTDQVFVLLMVIVWQNGIWSSKNKCYYLWGQPVQRALSKPASFVHFKSNCSSSLSDPLILMEMRQQSRVSICVVSDWNYREATHRLWQEMKMTIYFLKPRHHMPGL